MGYDVKVNGRRQWFDHLSNFQQISKSRWTVERNGDTYQIEGGRHAGGSSRDWFVDGGCFNGSIHCTSLLDALRLLENM